jgi:hypothetical protein
LVARKAAFSGANSDLLARPTLNEMLAESSSRWIGVTRPKVIRQVAAFVASCDASARDRWPVTDQVAAGIGWSTIALNHHGKLPAT